MIHTLRNRTMTAAAICRANGWYPGTKIVGDEGFGPTVIEITAIGSSDILARAILHNGKPVRHDSEANWTLDCRDWRRYVPPRIVKLRPKNKRRRLVST